jgi:16S rRNA (guanine966-N2)-methyltransferase
VRIIAGQWRGLTLASVGKGDDAARLRPTADRVRESIFNILMSMGNPPEGARVLDLFAGTGALGLEALSRGALHATFVDSGRTAQALIRANIARTGADAELLALDATRLPRNHNAPADLVFLDPPYGRGLGEKALIAAAAAGWLAPDALVVWEEGTAQQAPAGFRRIDERRWADTIVTFLEFADV